MSPNLQRACGLCPMPSKTRTDSSGGDNALHCPHAVTKHLPALIKYSRANKFLDLLPMALISLDNKSCTFALLKLIFSVRGGSETDRGFQNVEDS